MNKRFSILIVSTVIVGLTLSLVGMALTPQTASAEKAQNSYRQAPKPIPATDIKVIEKTLLPAAEETKGKPSSPPGLDKKEESGVATGVLGEPLAEGANKYAVVIGICQYPGEDYDICISDGDSYNMYQALTELYGYDPANIYWYRDMGDDPNNYGVDGAPTRSNIYNAVMNLKKIVTSSDEVVFFFSGHGGKGTADDGDTEDTDEAIIVHDDDGLMDEDGYSELDFIWDGELRSWFDGFATTRIVFVFDTCLAGGQNDVAGDGRVIAMSTGETQSAYVYSTGELGEGVFSHYFVNEGMLQGLADKYDHDSDGIFEEGEDVVVEEAFDYAKENIPPYLKQRQKPVISDNFTDDLLL